jgi:hypothetical protein
MGTILQVAGAATITISLGLIWLPLGVFTGGFMMILFGIAMGRNNA